LFHVYVVGQSEEQAKVTQDVYFKCKYLESVDLFCFLVAL